MDKSKFIETCNFLLEKISDPSAWNVLKLFVAIGGSIAGLHILNWWGPVMALDWGVASGIGVIIFGVVKIYAKKRRKPKR